VQLHATAKLVPSMRLLLVQRVLEEGWKIGEVAAAFAISEANGVSLDGPMARR
jgi:hypothetical protein